jgi:hypothetical protein
MQGGGCVPAISDEEIPCRESKLRARALGLTKVRRREIHMCHQRTNRPDKNSSPAWTSHDARTGVCTRGQLKGIHKALLSVCITNSPVGSAEEVDKFSN